LLCWIAREYTILSWWHRPVYPCLLMSPITYIYIFIHSTLYRPIKQTNSLKTFRMSVFPLYLKLFICSIVSSTAIHGKLVHLTSATTTVAPCAAAARALTHGKPSAPLVLLNLAGHHLRTPYSIPTICLVT
jgi:hypothetical protein